MTDALVPSHTVLFSTGRLTTLFSMNILYPSIEDPKSLGAVHDSLASYPLSVTTIGLI